MKQGRSQDHLLKSHKLKKYKPESGLINSIWPLRLNNQVP